MLSFLNSILKTGEVMYKNKYSLLIALLIGITLSSFSIKKDKTKLLARQWIMTGMKVNGKAISNAMMERQQRSGIVTILEFV